MAADLAVAKVQASEGPIAIVVRPLRTPNFASPKYDLP